MSANRTKINAEIQRINLYIIRLLLKELIPEIRIGKGLNSKTLPEKAIYEGMGINRATYSSVCNGKKCISYDSIEKNIWASEEKEKNKLKGFISGMDEGLIQEFGFSKQWWEARFKEKASEKHNFEEENKHEEEERAKCIEIIHDYKNEQEYENCGLVIDWIYKLANNNNRKIEIDIKRLIVEIEGIDILMMKSLDDDVLDSLCFCMQQKVDVASTILEYRRLEKNG